MFTGQKSTKRSHDDDDDFQLPKVKKTYTLFTKAPAPTPLQPPRKVSNSTAPSISAAAPVLSSATLPPPPTPPPSRSRQGVVTAAAAPTVSVSALPSSMTCQGGSFSVVGQPDLRIYDQCIQPLESYYNTSANVDVAYSMNNSREVTYSADAVVTDFTGPSEGDLIEQAWGQASYMS